MFIYDDGRGIRSSFVISEYHTALWSLIKNNFKIWSWKLTYPQLTSTETALTKQSNLKQINLLIISSWLPTTSIRTQFIPFTLFYSIQGQALNV